MQQIFGANGCMTMEEKRESLQEVTKRFLCLNVDQWSTIFNMIFKRVVFLQYSQSHRSYGRIKGQIFQINAFPWLHNNTTKQYFTQITCFYMRGVFLQYSQSHRSYGRIKGKIFQIITFPGLHNNTTKKYFTQITCRVHCYSTS